MQLVAKGLRRSSQQRIAPASGVSRKDRRPCETEQVIFPERLHDFGVHLSKLGAVAFVKDNDDVLLEHIMPFILGYEHVQLLNGRDDDVRSIILKLPLQYPGRCVAVGGALLEAVVFFHRLVIEVFSVDYKQYFVDIRQGRGQLRRLEGGQRFAAAGGMPDVPARINRTGFLVVGRYFDSGEDTLRRRDLVGAHDKQQNF